MKLGTLKCFVILSIISWTLVRQGAGRGRGQRNRQHQGQRAGQRRGLGLGRVRNRFRRSTTTGPLVQVREEQGRESDVLGSEATEPYSGERIRIRGNGTFFNSGRIEVYRGRKWGIVCDDEWDIKDATVACRQLGFTYGAGSAPINAQYGAGDWTIDDILMDGLKCNGDENSLHECDYFINHNCHQDEAASVVCRKNKGCDENWVAGPDSCYKLYGGASSRKSAMRQCARLNSNLVSIETEAENNFLSNLLMKTNSDKAIWYTGGKSRRGRWVWEKVERYRSRLIQRQRQSSSSRRRNSGRRIRLAHLSGIGYTKWFPGWDPSEYSSQPTGQRGETCVVLKREFEHPSGLDIRTNYYYWDDYRCKISGQLINFICEKDKDIQNTPLECYSGNGDNYRGFVSLTERGTMCANWQDSSFVNPILHPDKGLGDHNFCRNPDGDSRPWCWVNHSLRRFGYCDIPRCSPVVQTTTPPPAVATTTTEAQQLDCPGEEFFCSPSNKCINGWFRCDAENDCDEGEDEEECDYKLGLFERHENQMIDGSAKEFWRSIPVELCARFCLDRVDFVCKSFCYSPGDRTCFLMEVNRETMDLIATVEYDYYELQLQTSDCTDQFKCTNSKCIDPLKVCDGRDDCNDFSDEQDCDWPVVPTEVRIVDGEEHSGRVEVKHSGEWGIICDDSWDINDAHVICRMLGYEQAERESIRSEFGAGTLNMLLSDVDCYGNETSLDDCNKSAWGHRDCRRHEAAGVVCEVTKACTDNQFNCEATHCIPLQFVCDSELDCVSGSDEAECDTIEVRLVNGDGPNSGRLEVSQNGIWGTVCDDDWDDVDAGVACWMLGYRFGGMAVTGNSYEEGTGPIWLDDTACTGTETTLKDCPANMWGTSNCIHSEDAGVFCYTEHTPVEVGPTTTETSQVTDSGTEGLRVELINGAVPSEGRVEVIYEGNRGTICDDGWDNNDAAVVCRMLGYSGGEARSDAEFEPGSGDILLDTVECLGTESSLAECNHLGWGQHDCEHAEDAGAICEDSENVQEETGTTTGEPECGQRPIVSRQRRQFTVDEPRVSKIIGGNIAFYGQIPWQVGVRKYYSIDRRGNRVHTQHCGGTIISEYWILSAAHCYKNKWTKNDLLLRIGDLNNKVQERHEQEFEVERIINHDQYNHISYDYDIALLKVKPKNGHGIVFSDYVQPACLPTRNTPYSSGLECLISGWGTTSQGYPNIQKEATVPIINRNTCNSFNMYKGDVTENMFCAGYAEGGIDTCSGDSGGPLVCRRQGLHTVMGVTSWGRECGRPNSPGVYTHVAELLPWINSHIN